MSAMAVPVVNVGIVGVRVGQSGVHVGVFMRFPPVIIAGVFVLMVFVVTMAVAVFQCVVRMFVRMSFGQVEIDADADERARQPELGGRPLAEQQQ